MRPGLKSLIAGLALWAASPLNAASAANAMPPQAEDWPKTGIENADLDLKSLKAQGPRRASAALEMPKFLPLDLAGFVGGLEPVIAVSTESGAKAYPIRIVIAHGVVNDHLGTIPVAVSYCRDCSSAILRRREVDGMALILADSQITQNGTRIFFDSQSESWWREDNGRAIAGDYAGKQLSGLEAKIISMSQFRRLYGNQTGAQVLAETDRSRIAAQVQMNLPTPADSDLAPGVDPREEIPVVNEKSWTVDILAQEKRLGKQSPIILPDRDPRQQGPDKP